MYLWTWAISRFILPYVKEAVAAPDLGKCLSYWRDNLPMGRDGTCEEMAYAALFLAGDEEGHITGGNLYADGGLTSQLISREPYRTKSIETRKR